MKYQYDIITYLESDATLDTLLSSSANDSKIYPEIAPQDSSLPYIVYSVSDGVLDEILDEIRITFRIYSTTKSEAVNIANRLKSLLDKQDEIQNSFSSTDYWYYYSKIAYHESLIDNVDKDKLIYIQVMIFNIKYKRKTWY